MTSDTTPWTVQVATVGKKRTTFNDVYSTDDPVRVLEEFERAVLKLADNQYASLIGPPVRPGSGGPFGPSTLHAQTHRRQPCQLAGECNAHRLNVDPDSPLAAHVPTDQLHHYYALKAAK